MQPSEEVEMVMENIRRVCKETHELMNFMKVTRPVIPLDWDEVREDGKPDRECCSNSSQTGWSHTLGANDGDGDAWEMTHLSRECKEKDSQGQNGQLEHLRGDN